MKAQPRALLGKGPMNHAHDSVRHHRAAPKARDPVISMREALCSQKRDRRVSPAMTAEFAGALSHSRNE